VRSALTLRALLEASALRLQTCSIGRPPVTLGLYEAGFGICGGCIGVNLYEKTYSSFAADVPTAYGTDIVSVNLDTDVPLLNGKDYLLFLTGASGFELPTYAGPAQMLVDENRNRLPLTGDLIFGLIGPHMALALSDTKVSATDVPEPATWAMMLTGLVTLGTLARYSAVKK
jgi:hypothetical protein